ncbi:DUF2399 domain-containing protein [Tessaracoccus massiliensis]|uniref:DUF2399 domain-containing protein n=1 Tax=Tessaracoccus massiliensis TaxID=1522311 RepID=UPI00058EDE48|nr:DUF2399 domain-containing protein [Tessaracoccus massiliensis]
MTEPTISFAWLNVNSPGELKAASYLSGPNAKQYRFIVVVEEAADRLGRGSKPLVCTFGVPSLATHRLLSALPAKLFVRADADATGWGILRGLLGRYPEAQPWRMPEGSVGYEEEILEDLIADLEPT